MNKLIRVTFIALALMMPSSAAQASPIAIKILFSPFTTSFDSVVQSIGAVTMTIATDTTNPLLGSSFAGFYSATVTVDAPTLGLINQLVTSPTFFYINDDPDDPVIGFSDTVNNFGTIWTAFIGPGLPITDELDLTTLTVPFGPIAYTGTEFRTANPITFQNGSQFDAVGFQAFTQQANLVSAEAVPEPSTWLLFGTGLAVVGMRRRMKKRG